MFRVISGVLYYLLCGAQATALVYICCNYLGEREGNQYIYISLCYRQNGRSFSQVFKPNILFIHFLCLRGPIRDIIVTLNPPLYF